MEVVLLFTLLAFLPNAADAGRSQGCLAGWTLVKTKCFKFVRTRVKRHHAADMCRDTYGAYLAVIEDMEENRAVQDLIRGHRKVWIGLRQREGSGFRWDHSDKFQYNFANFRDSRRWNGDLCAVMRSDGLWEPSYCSSWRFPYVCSKKTNCEPGWTGDDCDRKCHCYEGFVCNATAICRYGCEPGWHGEMCDTYQETPTMSVYCMKQGEGAYSLMLSFSQPTDQTLGIVNAEGAISPNCSIEGPHRLKPGEMRFNVQIKNVSGVLVPDCPAETVADGILSWTIRWQRVKGVESFEDEEHQVQCDLSQADAAFDAKGVVVEKIRKRNSITATQTRVNVRAYLARPETLEPVTNNSLGLPVRLVVTLPEGDGVVNPLFNTGTCQASSPDGKVSIQLTNSPGQQYTNTIKEACQYLQGQA